MKPLPRDSWQEAWALAVDLTVADLQRANLPERCKKSGATWHPDIGTVEMVFLNRRYLICPPAFDVVPAEGGEPVPITEKILMLHYFNMAGGAAPAGDWIGFVEAPGGELYLQKFRARSVNRLVRAFNGREEKLIAAASEWGGVQSDYGDVSVEMRPFPNVPVLLALWRGDDEFPPSGDILFEAAVSHYLSTEDMVVLAERVVGRLCK